MPNQDNVVRERCNLCSKYIYTHHIALACHHDGGIYHATCKCLNITSSTAFAIQAQDYWMCPVCAADWMPFYNYLDYVEPTDRSCVDSNYTNCVLCLLF